MAVLHGLRFVDADGRGAVGSSTVESLLTFGEFAGEEDHDLVMELYVPWRESPYFIAVEYRRGWDDAGVYWTTTSTWVDGVQTDGSVVTVTVD